MLVFHDADDRAPRRRGVGLLVEHDPLANWVLSLEVLLRERLVDQHDGYAVRGIRRGERATGHERRANRLEEVGRDTAVKTFAAVSARGPSRHCKVGRVAGA